MHSDKLSVTQRVGYGAGDLGINLFFIASMTYLLYFYTDVMGISAAAAAGVMFVARLVDAVTDPMMGAIAERTRSRWGRMRPHILFGAVPMAIVAILTFTVPPFGETGKIWWAYLTYTLFGIAYTVISIPYSTLSASLTSDHDERTVLSTIRMAFAFAGGLVISSGMPKLVGMFPDEASGYQSTMMIFAVIATALLWFTVWQTAERVTPPEAQKLTLRDSLNAVIRNPPLVVVMVMFACGMLSFTIRQAVAAYYFKYNLGRPDLIGDWFMVTMPVMFVGLLFTPMLAKRYGKQGGIMVGAIVTIFAAAALYFTPYDRIELIFLWGAVMALGGTPIAVLGWAMLPDTVEYAQWRLGVRADGTIFAVSSFFQKLAKTIGGAGVALALSGVGYVANTAQSATSLATIHNLMTLAPIAIMVVLITAATSYRLDGHTHRRIVAELQAREQTASAGSAVENG
jgi:GPH family glycoside/pentoside/hexuronide:cation symporter